MPEVETVKSLFDLGGVVVVTVMLWIVWRRLNDVTDRLIELVVELKAARIATQTQANVNPPTLP